MSGLCGCFPSCSCQLNVTPPDLLNLVGNGDPLSGGWTLTATETPLALTSPDNAITVNNNGPYNHSPQINLNINDTSTVDLSIGVSGVEADVIIDPDAGIEDTGSGIGIKIDPASTAPVSVSPTGLLVDCCATSSTPLVQDSDTVALTTPAGILQADVILDPASPIPLTSSAAGLSAGPMDSVSTCVWKQGALVTVTGTTSLVFAENGAVATYNSAAGYRGMTWLDPADYVTAGGVCEARVVLNYGTVTSPSSKIGCSLWPVNSISSGNINLGTLLATAQTVSSAGADEVGAVETAWVVIPSAMFLVATFEWAVISGSTDTYGAMRIEVRQQ